MWALVIDGLVQEVTDIDPYGRFHPSLEWHACKSEVAPGWMYLDGIFFVRDQEMTLE